MRYEKIVQQFRRQPTEFLSAAVSKLKEDMGEAIGREDRATAKEIKKQLEAVKDVLLTR